MANYKMIFSPTGGTKKVTDILAEAMGGEWQEIDLSKAEHQAVLCADDVCLVSVPSYGGRVPATAIECVKKISGNGAKAVLICVYGNRAFEDTLTELQDALVSSGYCCAAAVAAIAEHSIARQFAAGRPDADDKKVLVEFAQQIKEKLAAPTCEDLILPGNHDTYKEFKGGAFPIEVKESCTNCGHCAELCPVGAIRADGSVDAETCISCMRCIAVCPVHARSLNEQLLAGVSASLGKVCSERRENELFL